MLKSPEISGKNPVQGPFSLSDRAAYEAWKAEKLRGYGELLHAQPVAVPNLSQPNGAAMSEIRARIGKTNLAIYQTNATPMADQDTRHAIRAFSEGFGLEIAEKHRSAGEQGLVALRVTDSDRQRGYIPYSRRPMNWHTDGYYNSPAERIRGMILHCVHPADDGGQNQFLDPEIVYIRLRDRDPDLVAALMHPEAMTIPENREADGSLRPEGPWARRSPRPRNSARAPN